LAKVIIKIKVALALDYGDVQDVPKV